MYSNYTRDINDIYFSEYLSKIPDYNLRYLS